MPGGSWRCRRRPRTSRRPSRVDRRGPEGIKRGSGAEGNRTLDLCSAIAALSQLSYRPRNGHCAERGRAGKGRKGLGLPADFPARTLLGVPEVHSDTLREPDTGSPIGALLGALNTWRMAERALTCLGRISLGFAPPKGLGTPGLTAA